MNFISSRIRPGLAIRYPKVPIAGLIAYGIPLAAFIWFVSVASYPLAGFLYALIFMILAACSPPTAVMPVFAGAPFITDLANGGPFRMSIGEINLALAFPVCVLQCMSEGRPLRMAPLGGPVAFYLGISLLSSLFNWQPSSTTALIQEA